MKKTARNIYLGFILFLMYAPIATLVVLSFNSSKSRSKWGGFTLKWYSSLFQDDAIMSALYNTLAIAFLSALIATIIGTCASLGITAMKGKMAHRYHGNYQYSGFKFRYRNRNFLNAAFYCVSFYFRLFYNPDCTHYF